MSRALSGADAQSDSSEAWEPWVAGSGGPETLVLRGLGSLAATWQAALVTGGLVAGGLGGQAAGGLGGQVTGGLGAVMSA